MPATSHDVAFWACLILSSQWVLAANSSLWWAGFWLLLGFGHMYTAYRYDRHYTTKP